MFANRKKTFGLVVVVLFLSATGALLGAEPGKIKGRLRTDSHGDPLPGDAVLRLGGLRFRHLGHINALAYSPDGKLVASAPWSFAFPEIFHPGIRVWDRATGKLRLLLKRQSARFGGLAFSPDGKKLVFSPDFGNTVIVWDMASNKKLWQCKATVFAFSKNGKTLFAGGAGAARPQYYPSDTLLHAIDNEPISLFDMATGKKRKTLGKGIPLDISADGKRLLSVAGNPVGNGANLAQKRDHVLLIWDIKTGRELHRQPVDKKLLFQNAIFTPRGVCFALRKVKRQSQSFWRWLPTKKKVEAISTNGSDESGRFNEIRRLLGAGGAMAVSPNGKEMVSCSDSTLTFWDAATDEKKPTFGGHQSSITSVAFSPDGKWISSTSRDNTLRLWDCKTGKQVRCVKSPKIGLYSFADAAFSPDGKFMAACDRFVWIWNTETEKRIQRWGIPYLDEYVPFRKLAFSPDGKWIAAGGVQRGTVTMRDTVTGKKRWQREVRYEEDFGCVHQLDFSPDGRILAVATWDLQVTLLDAATGKVLRRMDVEGVKNRDLNLFSATFLPYGRSMATGFLKSIKLWELASGKLRVRIDTPSVLSSEVAVSPDGSLIASGHFDGTVCLWDAVTGKKRHTFTGHQGRVFALAFSADGKNLASGSEDTTVIVWKVPLHSKTKAVAHLSEKEIRKLWQKLAQSDAEAAFAAQRQLARAASAVTFLKQHLHAVKAPAAGEVQKWVKDLDSDGFKIRSHAQQHLEDVIDLAEPTLRRALKKPLTLETHQRIELLLQHVDAATGKRLQALRGLEVLEWIGTADARKIIVHIAKGAANSRITQDAQATLKRMAK